MDKRIIALLLVLVSLLSGGASLACGSSCVTLADVSAETSAYNSNSQGAKCLFIYSGAVYLPPSGTISGGMHMGLHACGADVSGIMRASHLKSPSKYLLPYTCAPLCSEQTTTTAPTTVPTTTVQTTVPAGQPTSTTIQGAPTTSTTAQTSIPSENAPQTTVPEKCVPSCTSLCGQDNGCGGACPDSQKGVLGQCGNPECRIDCSFGACGQPDGCGGYCSSFDRESCGLCGNAPCCESGCVGNSSSPNSAGSSGSANSGQPELSAKKEKGFLESKFPPNSLARAFGLSAFLFAGLAVIAGLFERSFSRILGEGRVIAGRLALGAVTLAFAAAHVLAILADKAGWAGAVGIINVLLPSFSGGMKAGLALGTIGLYALLASVIFLAVLASAQGTAKGAIHTAVHFASIAVYFAIFPHAMILGTDFSGNPYAVIAASQVGIAVAIKAGISIYRKIRKGGPEGFT